MAYVDAFVVPVPRDRIEDYKAFTRSPLPFDGGRMFWGGFQPIVEWTA